MKIFKELPAEYDRAKRGIHRKEHWHATVIALMRNGITLFRRNAACIPPLGYQTAAALITDVDPQPVEDNAQPIAYADQEIDVRKAPDPPGKRPAQLDAAEIDDGQPLSDRGQAAGMSVTEIGNVGVAAQASPNDRRDVASLLFCSWRDARDWLSVWAGDRHRIADGEDLRMARNCEIWQDQEPPGAVGWCPEPFRGR